MFDSAGLAGWVETAMELASGSLVSFEDRRDPSYAISHQLGNAGQTRVATRWRVTMRGIRARLLPLRAEGATHLPTFWHQGTVGGPLRRWPEQMNRKMYRNVWETRSSRSQKRSERGQEVLAARPAGYPWPEQMDHKKYRKVEISGVPAADLPERFDCSGERYKDSRKHQLSDHRLGPQRGPWRLASPTDSNGFEGEVDGP